MGKGGKRIIIRRGGFGPKMGFNRGGREEGKRGRRKGGNGKKKKEKKEGGQKKAKEEKKTKIGNRREGSYAIAGFKEEKKREREGKEKKKKEGRKKEGKKKKKNQTFSSMKFKQPSRGTKAEILLPFFINWTLTHLRMAELGCLASIPL